MYPNWSTDNNSTSEVTTFPVTRLTLTPRLQQVTSYDSLGFMQRVGGGRGGRGRGNLKYMPLVVVPGYDPLN